MGEAPSTNKTACVFVCLLVCPCGCVYVRASSPVCPGKVCEFSKNKVSDDATQVCRIIPSFVLLLGVLSGDKSNGAALSITLKNTTKS